MRKRKKIKNPKSDSYEETHRKVTFCCPIDVLRHVDAQAILQAESRTTIIVEALRKCVVEGK